jgi:uncharacterized protein YjbI with pentapeptide repeats
MNDKCNFNDVDVDEIFQTNIFMKPDDDLITVSIDQGARNHNLLVLGRIATGLMEYNSNEIFNYYIFNQTSGRIIFALQSLASGKYIKREGEFFYANADSIKDAAVFLWIDISPYYYNLLETPYYLCISPQDKKSITLTDDPSDNSIIFTAISSNWTTEESRPFSNLDYSYADFSLLKDPNLTGWNFSQGRMFRTNFSGVTLNNTNFSEVDLKDAIFTNNTSMKESKLNKTIFTGVDMSGFDLAGSNLSESTLENAILCGANLSGADLSNANLSAANLTDAILSNSKHLDTNLTSATLSKTDLTNAILKGTNFSNTNVTTTKFSAPPAFSTDPGHLTKFNNAVLNFSTIGKNWTCLDLTNSNIVGFESQKDLSELKAEYAVIPDFDLVELNLKGADFSHADMTRTNLSYSDLRNAKFQETILTGTVCVKANLECADLTGAQLGGLEQTVAADFSYSYMANVKLDKANLYGVNMPHVTLFGAYTSITNTSSMELINLSNAYLEGINLSMAILKGAKMDSSCLVNVNFTGADLSPTMEGSIKSSLTDTCLQGANFSNSKLIGVELSNAAVAFDDGSIPVNYCDGSGEIYPPPPGSMPLKFPPTQGLDLTTMDDSTICPNGHTVEDNQGEGISLQQMLTSPNAPENGPQTPVGPQIRLKMKKIKMA